MVYTVTFNPAVDYIVHTKELTAGAVNRSDREEIYFGGKGINVSLVLSELGVKSRALGFVAGFAEKTVVDRCDGFDRVVHRFGVDLFGGDPRNGELG